MKAMEVPPRARRPRKIAADAAAARRRRRDLFACVAHRGFAGRYPENTLAAVRAALRLGCRWVEVDVQLSADGVPVVVHDASLRRVSGRRGDVRKMPWSALKNFPAHEPGRFGLKFRRERLASLARLARALARLPGARLFVELKDESLKRFGREAMLRAVDRALGPVRRRCILISFDQPVLRLARQSTPYPLGVVLRSWRDLRSGFFSAVRPEFVFCGVKRLPRQGSLRLPGSRLCVYEVPNPAQGRALLRRGADLIETFAVDAYLQ